MIKSRDFVKGIKIWCEWIVKHSTAQPTSFSLKFVQM